jgi:protein-S-isoprenylcysteine O-methyltransferase Ste14
MAEGIRKKARSLADGQAYFLILLILSILSHFVFPVRGVLHPPFTFFGIIIIGFGFVMAFWSRSLFLKNTTTLSPYESPTFLITTGPFRISRNPVYLAMAAILFGSAVLLGTLVPFVFTVLFIVIIGTLFIPDEEQSLETLFGGEFREYKKTVRRWIETRGMIVPAFFSLRDPAPGRDGTLSHRKRGHLLCLCGRRNCRNLHLIEISRKCFYALAVRPPLPAPHSFTVPAQFFKRTPPKPDLLKYREFCRI